MTYKFASASILVVDDMPPMLSLTKTILATFGFRNIYTARNGEDAFEKFRRHDPDLVITDWVMEPMDGLELIKKIRTDPMSSNPYVPIILMTGYSALPRVETARDKGTTEFVVKPFTAKDLYNRIVQVIEKPRQFVQVEEFFGPDRRRKSDTGYGGQRRRENDGSGSSANRRPQNKLAADILRQLADNAKSTSK